MSHQNWTNTVQYQYLVRSVPSKFYSNSYPTTPNSNPIPLMNIAHLVNIMTPSVFQGPHPVQLCFTMMEEKMGMRYFMEPQMEKSDLYNLLGKYIALFRNQRFMLYEMPQTKARAFIRDKKKIKLHKMKNNQKSYGNNMF